MIGVDEVGRGCWAGPMLIVAARGTLKLPEGLKDSKKLSKNQREKLQTDIKRTCDLGEGWVSAQEIDRLGLTDGTKLETTICAAMFMSSFLATGSINMLDMAQLCIQPP
jgi:ribonuclease HII